LPCKESIFSTINVLRRTFKVVALLGPRQSGKTTLARQIAAAIADFPAERNYFDLKDPVHLDRLENPKLALDGLLGLVVAIQKELGLPIEFIGLGEQPDDLQPFDAKQFAPGLPGEWCRRGSDPDFAFFQTGSQPSSARLC